MKDIFDFEEFMMTELFDVFPYIENDKVIIRKMDMNDVAALPEISNNDNVYKYISPFLYKESNKLLETAIKNLGGRDFEKKKLIMMEYLASKIGITTLNAFV